jgi:diguanylate cyclase (GGDEF)-like protein/PAS domain S-box-containing protein
MTLEQYRRLAGPAARSAAWPAEKHSIVARLSTFDTSMVVFSLVVGIGIFRTPAIVAGAAGSTTMFYAAWIVGGVIALVGALTFAEIGARYSRAGGYYRVVADCYHPALAFMLNWCQTLMQGAGAAGVAYIGVDYLARWCCRWRMAGTAGVARSMACALMLVLLVLNYIGIRSGARTQNILSMLKIVMMVGLGVFALLLATRAAPLARRPAVELRPWSMRLLSALVPCFYAYGGYQLTMNLSADIKDSSRRLPLAIVAGMLAVVGLYLLLNVAYQQVLGTDHLPARNSSRPRWRVRLSDARRRRGGISVAIFLSAAGFVNATILQMPRTFYAMAEDGVLPAIFKRVNPKTQVQEFGLIAFGVTMLVPAFFLNSFEKLLNYVIFTDNLTLATVASTLFMLRRRGVASTGFVMPGYPWLPAIYFVCLVAASMRVLVTEPGLALAGTLLFVTGAPLFWLGRAESANRGTRTASRTRRLLLVIKPPRAQICRMISHSVADIQAPSQAASSAVPAWVDRALFGMVFYSAVCMVWMLGGIGGATVSHYVGLLADMLPNILTACIALATARSLAPGALRRAWRYLATSHFLMLTGYSIGVSYWLRNIDPFPGIGDIFYIAYYPAMLLGAYYLVRAAAVRVPWLQIALDAAIFVIGFGAFFWFLVIRPAVTANEIDVIKHALSGAYLVMNSVLLLCFGVVLIAGNGNPGGRRVPLLLLTGFALNCLGDILWALAKVNGQYLPGGLQDVLYIVSWLPLAYAGREQMRAARAPVRSESAKLDGLARLMPYGAMLCSFIVLAYFTRPDQGGPATTMTAIVFALGLLLMVRQTVLLREDATVRERRAALMVEQRYASLIANASDVIMIVDLGGLVRFASPATERTLGLKPADIVGRRLTELWTGEDSERLRMFLDDVAGTEGVSVGPEELRLVRGSSRYVLEIVGSNLARDPAVNGLSLNFRDISERKALEEQLRELAFHDPLTLLANRNLFRDRVQHALTLARRGRQSVAVMFLDLDNFKDINDTLGHDAGDQLLQAVAQRLVKATRAADTVARLGGDEFGILLEDISTSAEAERVATSLIEALETPVSLGSNEVRIAATIGVAFSAPGAGAEALLGKADIAMYHAKSAGKNRYAVFKPEMQELLQERIRLEGDLGRALVNDELYLEYQPIVDLGTRSLLGVEALVRWRHPELGVLMPARFIQMAEECGRIVAVGRWVLSRACRDMVAWRGAVAGGDALRVSVNISGRHLQHGDLVQDVSHALRESGLEPGNLVIELTESTIMYNTDINLERLRQLKALGVRLAIDDFGTGYSSLSYLHRFPIDILKIDRSFVGRLTHADDGPELARAVITLGDTLGLDSVAEGIELESEVVALLYLGCVAGQGFLFSEPCSLEEVLASSFVARRNALWTEQVPVEDQSPSGRFPALKGLVGRTAGAA